MQFLLMCRSLTYAQRTARVLAQAGITASVTRAPKAISTHGCGSSAAVSARNGRRAMEILEKSGMRPERVYRKNADGTLEEAEP